MWRAVVGVVAPLTLVACGQADAEPVAAEDIGGSDEAGVDEEANQVEQFARERERTSEMSDEQLQTRRDRLADVLEDSAPGSWSDQRTESELTEALEDTALVSQVDTLWVDRSNHQVLIAGSASAERAVQDDGQLLDGARLVVERLARELEPHNVTSSTFPRIGVTVDLSGHRVECPSETVHELFQIATSRNADPPDDVMDDCVIQS